MLGSNVGPDSMVQIRKFFISEKLIENEYYEIRAEEKLKVVNPRPDSSSDPTPDRQILVAILRIDLVNPRHRQRHWKTFGATLNVTTGGAFGATGGASVAQGPLRPGSGH